MRCLPDGKVELRMIWRGRAIISNGRDGLLPVVRLTTRALAKGYTIGPRHPKTRRTLRIDNELCAIILPASYHEPGSAKLMGCAHGIAVCNGSVAIEVGSAVEAR